MSKTSVYETKKWLDLLKSKGIKTYTFRYLPFELKDMRYQQKAAKKEWIKKTGNYINDRLEWEIII